MGDDRQQNNDLFAQAARIGKALANGSRLELLELVAQGERDVASLAAVASLKVSTASAHLQTLLQAHLVTTRRDGTRVLYDLAGTDVADLVARLRQAAHTHLPDAQAARTRYLGTGNSPAVTREQLLTLVQASQITVLDVRPHHEYTAVHIPGAIGLPLSELGNRLTELPPQQVVAYCRSAFCALAHHAVRLLHARGRHDAVILDHGMLEWRVAGMPLEAAAGSRRS